MLASNENCLSSGFHHSRSLSWSLITGFLPNAFAVLFLPLDLAPGVLLSHQTPLKTHRPGSELVFVLSTWEEEAVWPLGSVSSVLLNITTAEACG